MSSWLSEFEATLSALERLDLHDTSPSGFAVVDMATRQLADLNQRFRNLTAAERRSLGPHMEELNRRIGAVATRLSTAQQNMPKQLQSLKYRGRALSAYLLSDSKK